MFELLNFLLVIGMLVSAVIVVQVRGVVNAIIAVIPGTAVSANAGSRCGAL